MQSRLCALRKEMRTDTGVLALLLVLFTARTLGYLIAAVKPTEHIVDRHVGLSPLIWGGMAVVIAVALVCRKRLLVQAALALAVAVLMLWGVLFAWISFDALLLHGTLYLAVAVGTVYTVWRGNSQELHVYGGGADARRGGC